MIPTTYTTRRRWVENRPKYGFNKRGVPYKMKPSEQNPGRNHRKTLNPPPKIPTDTWCNTPFSQHKNFSNNNQSTNNLNGMLHFSKITNGINNNLSFKISQ